MEFVDSASLQAEEDDWDGPGFVYEYAVGAQSGGRSGEWLVPAPQRPITSVHRKCSMDEQVVIKSLLHAFLDFFALGWTHTWLSRLFLPVTRLWQRSQKRITVALSPKPPVNRIPPELLSRIFATYLDDCKPPKDITKHKGDVNWRVGLCQLPTVTPLQLTGVCQYWREVALSTPTLWSTIHVDRPNLPEHVRLFSMWLENSAPAPLDLTYNQPRPLYFDNDGGSRSNTATSILKAMFGQLRRWRTARIYLKQDKRDMAKLASSDGFLTSLCPPAFLESFELELAGWNDENALTLLGLLFSSPVLREVDLHDPFTYPSSAAIQDTAWKRLTRITLHDTDVASLVGCLPFCEQLRHLRVHRLRHADVPEDTAVISLPRLKKLHLDKATGLDAFFNRLNLPSLRKLVCENGEFSTKKQTQSQEEANWKSLLEMLERSKCTLKSFGWSCKQPYEFTEECLVRHLASPLFHGLQHLCLCKVSNLALTALRVTVKSSLLPQLSRMEFDYCFATDGVFTAMIRSDISDYSLRSYLENKDLTRTAFLTPIANLTPSGPLKSTWEDYLNESIGSNDWWSPLTTTTTTRTTANSQVEPSGQRREVVPDSSAWLWRDADRDAELSTTGDELPPALATDASGVDGLVQPTARFQLALDALLPILDASTPAELASRILVSFILYTLYAPHPIAVNPFKSAIFTTYQSEREKAVNFAYDGGVSPNEQLVWVLWKILKGDGNDIGPYSPSTLARSPLPPKLRAINLDLDDELCNITSDLSRDDSAYHYFQDKRGQSAPSDTNEFMRSQTSSRVVSPDYSFERDKQNERLLQAVKLLLAARERVLNLAEVRALVPMLSEVATSRMVTSLDLGPIVAYNPTIAHPLFVGLVSNPNPESNNPMPFLEVLPYLPPTLPSFDLMGRLLRDQTFIKVAGYSTVADLVRIEVLELFIQQCINWIEQAEREQQQGLISDDRFEKGLQHLCRFFMSLIKLKIIDSRSDTDCAEMSTFCLHHARFEEANALYRVIMHGSNF